MGNNNPTQEAQKACHNKPTKDSKGHTGPPKKRTTTTDQGQTSTQNKKGPTKQQKTDHTNTHPTTLPPPTIKSLWDKLQTQLTSKKRQIDTTAQPTTAETGPNLIPTATEPPTAARGPPLTPTGRDIKVMTLNIRGIFPNRHTLSCILTDNSPDILTLTETKLLKRHSKCGPIRELLHDYEYYTSCRPVTNETEGELRRGSEGVILAIRKIYANSSRPTPQLIPAELAGRLVHHHTGSPKVANAVPGRLHA
jgi:hypothetical protein